MPRLLVVVVIAVVAGCGNGHSNHVRQGANRDTQTVAVAWAIEAVADTQPVENIVRLRLTDESGSEAHLEIGKFHKECAEAPIAESDQDTVMHLRCWDEEYGVALRVVRADNALVALRAWLDPDSNDADYEQVNRIVFPDDATLEVD